MKKLLFIGAMALSTFTFANTKEEVKENKQEVKQEKTAEAKELTQEQKEALALYFLWYQVSFQNSCGNTSTVFFQSEHEDGSQPFIRELAFAVNDGYANC
ncbi:hypothetical protein [Chryseobacterium herbae]|uniref:Uncharacterized protein n=1 Tax=Chryseobacterium herbae TaxID=2976476 RepID=A0ABT2J077_9FLAO|nr:hypothetical protein [Chryseobacterium sp. pc1-10]MCT2564116.1 hypothetical protein [Chryseobacterium sp. pc1-10]